MFAMLSRARLHLDLANEHAHIRIRRRPDGHAEFGSQINDLCRWRDQLKIAPLDLARQTPRIELSAGRSRWRETRRALQDNSRARIKLELREARQQVNRVSFAETHEKLTWMQILVPSSIRS